MLKCPFCGFDNEDGALFCEQCKSDLGGTEAAPSLAEPTPVAAAVIGEHVAQPYPAEPAGLGAAPHMAEPVPFTAPPLGETGHEIPVAAPIAAAGGEIPLAAPMETTPEEMPAAPPAGDPAATTAASAQPRLVVLRGLKINAEYPVYSGENFIGRADEKPVDIDLEDQEAPDRIWSSRQHACIIMEDSGKLTIEDLNSSNGTFVNRTRVYPGQKRELAANDVIQIGTVQMKVKL